MDARHEDRDNASPVADNEGGETCEKKKPYIVGYRRAAERHDRFSVPSFQVPSIKEESRAQKPGAIGANGLRARESRDR